MTDPISDSIAEMLAPNAPDPQLPPPAPPGVTVITNVRLEEVEKAVYARDHERASHLTLSALRNLKQGAEFIGYATEPRLKTMLYTRFCAAVVSLLSDPKFGLSQDGFDHFASEHAVADLLFRASTFETSDHMLAHLASNPAETDPSKMHIADGAGLVKFLLTYSMRSSFGLNFEQTFKRSPQIMFSLWAGMISPLLTTAVQAQDRREELLGLWPVFEGVTLSDAVLPTLSDAYMYTSYGLRRDKHDAKGLIHRLFAKMLRDRGIKLPDDKVIRSRRHNRPNAAGRPTLLICVEWFTGLHAMFRCYAPIIRELRARFRLVGMSRASDIDDTGKAEFDEWIEVPGANLDLGALVRTIVSDVRPDIIYYPSLGMAMWWTIMASVRLAPIQMMTLGHPASSRSPCLDYVICEDGSIGDPALFTEKIVTMPAASARFVMRQDAQFPEPLTDDHPEVVRIAVPAMLCKLNARFMAALRDISQRAADAGRKTEFHFFVNMLGINLHQAAREIRDWLPTALVYERMHYNAYLQHLAQCHMHLCSFPFGGTNSNIDSMLLGLPILAMAGDQPHERFDAVMVRRAGLGEGFVATSVDEYVQRAAALITDDAARNAARDHLRATDLHALFFGQPEPEVRGSFLNAVQCVYEHHEAMQASAGRVFDTAPSHPVKGL